MTSRRRATHRAFTIIVCSCCSVVPGACVLEQLQKSIRCCPHGVLVSASCLLGKHMCAARIDGPGAMVLLQPCSRDRSPVGLPRWVGPVSNPADTQAVRAWIESGAWNLGALPERLRSPLNSLGAQLNSSMPSPRARSNRPH